MTSLHPAGGRLLSTVAMGTLAACASGGSRAELLSDWTPPEGQSCTIAAEPDTLPPVSSLVELDRLRGAIARTLEQPHGHALFSLVYDSTGTWRRVAVIESDLQQSDQEGLTTLLRSQLKIPPHPRLRLRLDVGEPIRMAVGRSEGCAPSLRNALEITQRVNAMSSAHARRATVVLRVWVNAEGTPGQAEVARSSGDPRLDAEVRSLARYMRFHPALDDRVPVAVWAEFPVTVGSSG